MSSTPWCLTARTGGHHCWTINLSNHSLQPKRPTPSMSPAQPAPTQRNSLPSYSSPAPGDGTGWLRLCAILGLSRAPASAMRSLTGIRMNPSRKRRRKQTISRGSLPPSKHAVLPGYITATGSRQVLQNSKRAIKTMIRSRIMPALPGYSQLWLCNDSSTAQKQHAPQGSSRELTGTEIRPSPSFHNQALYQHFTDQGSFASPSYPVEAWLSSKGTNNFTKYLHPLHIPRLVFHLFNIPRSTGVIPALYLAYRTFQWMACNCVCTSSTLLFHPPLR